MPVEFACPSLHLPVKQNTPANLHQEEIWPSSATVLHSYPSEELRTESARRLARQRAAVAASVRCSFSNAALRPYFLPFIIGRYQQRRPMRQRRWRRLLQAVLLKCRHGGSSSTRTPVATACDTQRIIPHHNTPHHSTVRHTETIRTSQVYTQRAVITLEQHYTRPGEASQAK
jgi:hypothetical protein